MRSGPRGKVRPAVVLTANRRRGRFLVLISGKPVWLTGGLFSTLCQLVSARMTTSMGYVSASPMVVCRLRRAIESALSYPEDAMTLIETGVGQEYRLTIEPGQIVLDGTFSDYPMANVIGEETLKQLRPGHPGL